MKSNFPSKRDQAWKDTAHHSKRTVKLPSGIEVSILDLHEPYGFQIKVGSEGAHVCIRVSSMEAKKIGQLLIDAKRRSNQRQLKKLYDEFHS